MADQKNEETDNAADSTDNSPQEKAESATAETRETPVAGVEAVPETPADDAAEAEEAAASEAVAAPSKAAKAKKSAAATVPAPEDFPATVRPVYEVGPRESTPGNPKDSAVYSPGMEEAWEGPIPNRTTPKPLIAVIVVIALIFGLALVVMPEGLRSDTFALLEGRNVIQEREMREQARIEAERQAMLDAAPKYGNIEIVTIPNNMMVVAEGQETLIYPGSRRDIVQPTRTRVAYQDISVTEPFVFTILGEGVYQDRQVTVEPFGSADSVWVQNMSGQYAASMTITMEPNEEHSREIAWRRTYRPDPAQERGPLYGEIRINTEPEGALVIYNRIPVMDEEGNPMLTPMSFSDHPAPPDSEDQDRRRVHLSRDGIRVDLFMDGKAVTAMGVFLHQYRCERREDVEWPADDVEEPDFYGLCNYVLDIETEIREVKPEEEEEGEEGEESEEGETAEADDADDADDDEADDDEADSGD